MMSPIELECFISHYHQARY